MLKPIITLIVNIHRQPFQNCLCAGSLQVKGFGIGYIRVKGLQCCIYELKIAQSLRALVGTKRRRGRLFCFRSPTFPSDIASDIGQGDGENGDIVPKVKVIGSFRQQKFT